MQEAQDRVEGALVAAMIGYIDGDPRAFEGLHRLVAPRLRRLLRRLVGEDEAAEDLLQVTMLKGHLARDRFVFTAEPCDRAVLAWYSAIARNTGLDHLRRRGRAAQRHAAGAEDEAIALEQAADSRPSSEALLVSEEEEAAMVARVQEALAALPPKQREVVELHKFQEMSMAEVAARLAIQEGAARVRAHRAYKALAAWLRPAMSLALSAGLSVGGVVGWQAGWGR